MPALTDKAVLTGKARAVDDDRAMSSGSGPTESTLELQGTPTVPGNTRTIAWFPYATLSRSNSILALLVNIVMRTPRLALAALLLALVALAGTSTYAGYLVIGMVAEYLGSGHFVAGLLLGILFFRLPKVRDGKLLTVGLLPKRARLPAVLALLAVCLTLHAQQREMVPAVFLGLAAVFLVTFRWMRQAVVKRVKSMVLSPDRNERENTAVKRIDPSVIDVEFREKKD